MNTATKTVRTTENRTTHELPESDATVEAVDVVINGIDVETLGAAIESVKENPALGQARFRAQNRWISGAHNRTTIQGFYAAGGEDESREQPFVLDSDEPPLHLRVRRVEGSRRGSGIRRPD